MESRIVLKAFTIGPVRRLRAGIELSIELGLGVRYKRGNLKVGRGVSIWFVGWIVKGFNHGEHGDHGRSQRIYSKVRGEAQRLRRAQENKRLQFRSG